MAEQVNSQPAISVVNRNGENVICETTSNFFTLADLQAKLVAVDKQIEQVEAQLGNLRGHKLAVQTAILELETAKLELKIAKDSKPCKPKK